MSPHKPLREDFPEVGKYSFCESMYATGSSPWHVRLLTEKGRKLGGGADTSALCGRQVAWDLSVELTQHHLTHCCRSCASLLETRVPGL